MSGLLKRLHPETDNLLEFDVLGQIHQAQVNR